MKILMASAEMAPLARTGGLGDVLEALPMQLQAQGHEVSVVLPLYRIIRENPLLKITSTGVKLQVAVGGKQLDSEIFECQAPNGVQLFLVQRDEYFDRSGIYGPESSRAYDDNAERFIYFSKVVVELARHMKPALDILHAHDWTAALVPAFVRDQGLPFGTVYTIHNLAYQGDFWGNDFSLTNLPGHYFSEHGLEFYGRLNFMKGGIVYADAVTTVSERYAHEIQTPEYGCGLDGVLRAHAYKLKGIINGADYDRWDPSRDAAILEAYSADAPSGKAVSRNALLEELNLAPNPRGPVFAIVSRLADQKGIDLLLPLLDRLLSDDVRLVILGEGDPRFERELLVASRKYPEKFAFRTGFDEPLAHRIYAGADAFLIPSHFEPCGLTAMYALKYGTIPIVRASGGLYQIVRDDDPAAQVGRNGTGFVFFEGTSEAFWDAISRTKEVFADCKAWAALRDRAMREDFSWPNSTAKYESLYKSILPKDE